MRSVALVGLLAVPVSAVAAGDASIASKRPKMPAVGAWKLTAKGVPGAAPHATGSFTVTKRHDVDHVSATIAAVTNNGVMLCAPEKVKMVGDATALGRNVGVPIIYSGAKRKWVVATSQGSLGHGLLEATQITLNEGSVLVGHKREAILRTETLEITFAGNKTSVALSYDNGQCTAGFSAKRG